MKFLKFHKQDSYKNHGRLLGWGSGANTDWRIMFTVFLVLAALITIYCVYLFLHVRRETAAQTEASPEVLLEIETLKRVAEHYSRQQKAFETLGSAPETTLDPSI